MPETLFSVAMYLFYLLTVLTGGMLRITESCKSAGITTSTTTSPGITTTTATSSGITTTTTTTPVPGVIITGGDPFSSVGVKVEVFNMKTNKTCELPDLPGGVRVCHSQCGHLLCGGGYYPSSTQRSCLILNPLTGDFTPTSVTLRERRVNHLCWDVEGENGPTLLMGGISSPRSTELVSSNGSSSSANFTLTYDTK